MNAHPQGLSIIVVIKNRTHIMCEYKSKTITLRLFENNLNSLLSLHKPTDYWELIVIDFDSTDVNMSQFLSDKFNDPVHTSHINTFTYKLQSIVGEKFCKGKGLNIGANVATHNTLFFLDADMQITTRDIFNYGIDAVTQDDKVYFPICNSYDAPDHKSYKIRSTGTGNVFISKADYQLCKWIENKSWGGEDTAFYNFFKAKQMTTRNTAKGNFYHQWHPNSSEFKNKYYKQI